MVLADVTWPMVEAFDRECVVLIPTGSLEQHGRHLPLWTDSLIVTEVARAVEKRLPNQVILTPTLWLGASAHHLPFAGSLSNGFDPYMGAVASVVESLVPHGFHKFFIVNGHGGNEEPNGMVLRGLKSKYPSVTFGHSGYYAYAADEAAAVMEGPIKHIQHACEAEVSLVLHLRPDLVRQDQLQTDGLNADPPIRGLVHQFDEITEHGSFGYAKLGTAEKGKVIFDAAVAAMVREMEWLAQGYVLRGIDGNSQ